MKNVERMLKNYSVGLALNTGVSSLEKLAFSYHMIKDHIDEVISFDAAKKENSTTEGHGRQQSCLILEKEPGR